MKLMRVVTDESTEYVDIEALSSIFVRKVTSMYSRVDQWAVSVRIDASVYNLFIHENEVIAREYFEGLVDKLQSEWSYDYVLAKTPAKAVAKLKAARR